MSSVLPPKTIDELRADLADPTVAVYLVIGQPQDLAWIVAEATMGDYPRTEAWLATDAVLVREWLLRDDVSAWPEGSVWPVGNIPVGVCFGYRAEPVIYLDQGQAEDHRVVRAAHRRARQL